MAFVSDSLLDPLLHSFRQAAAALPDARRGSNKRYAVADAAACALATFFFQAPSFLSFQRRMQTQSARSNCHTLFGVQAIPCDAQIRNLLDGLAPDRFADLFPRCLDTLQEQGALAPFERLGGRLLVALDGLQIHCSDSIRCEQCSTRHVGKHKTEQYFHTMLSATVVADGHNRVIPLMPEFVQPQQDPAAQRPELTEKRRKQDCERNAAKRWLPAHIDELQTYRPVFLGDDLYCCQSLCRLVRNLGADFLFVCKPSSHKRLQEVLHDDFIHSSGWIKARNQPEGAERLEWFLLTTLAVQTQQEAERVLEWYKLRWRIEDWYRVLKSGCKVEYLGHRQGERIERAVTINAVIAWRLTLMTLLGRDTPELPADTLFTEIELATLGDFAQDRRQPPPDNLGRGGADAGDAGRVGVSTKFRTIWAVAAMAVEWSRRSSALHDC